MKTISRAPTGTRLVGSLSAGDLGKLVTVRTDRAGLPRTAHLVLTCIHHDVDEQGRRITYLASLEDSVIVSSDTVARVI